MADKESFNSATGLIYSQIKKINAQQNFGSHCPEALKKILNQNFQNEYLQQQQHVISEESKTKKRLNYDRMMEINEQENQKKEIIFTKFLDAVQNSKKYWDQNFYRAPFQVKTNGLSKCIDESSQWYQQKTKEVVQRDIYMKIVDKFSLIQKQQQFHEAPNQIYKIEEQVQQEIQDISNQDIISQNNQNNHSDKNDQKEEQKYYIMNNFQKNAQFLKPSLPNSRSSYLNTSKVKRQSTNSNDPSSTQPTQTSFNSQFFKKIYSNDYTQLQDEIGKLQKAENEKEAQNIIQSQKILTNKIVSRNMSSLFNIKKKSKNNFSQDKSATNLNNSEQSISVQGKNIQTLSQNYFQKINTEQQQVQDQNKTQTALISKFEFENDLFEGVTPDRCSPFLQPKMRQVMSQTMRSFSLDRNTNIKLIQRPQSAQIPYNNLKSQNLRPQSAQSISLLAQMSSFPSRSTKKLQIKKGLIKRAQSANPKIQQKNTNQDNLFSFTPIKYTNLRPDIMINNSQKDTQYGNFFAQNKRFSKNQYEKIIQ
ncbi:hypothetical protein TTHERM_00146380 (macronuclear) [Tetrahymena thermophila SB210]|uniref:Uncharacterized protein n=1 Tax=Tetrahymena thermophila (strain SB210) TaxID=312017 RepID=I7MIA1_TETTS|nr:hypothetical protein TTHERM_00146380 [Tetrahymena thermophila SB210]EAR91032.2 hypothetical protein TTHERM_00146380 [Tetrahymena thermophila SB210]|eukprot:XP_001011277.2 hypothetical protein TTHERM_00146380 [Tetrahymena thermophila SB210]